jgi:osmoprotectant transport system permease protein
MRSFWFVPLLFVGCAPTPELVVGSKADGESVLLGEMAQTLVQTTGVRVRHQARLGGTPVLWAGLLAGSIDLYPEYTGTIRQQLLRDVPTTSDADLPALLAARGVGIGPNLGFANNYALGMRAKDAAKLGIRTIADLRQHPQLTFGFSAEFMARSDGWPNLSRRYGLPHTPKGMDHQLAYVALANGDIAATDLYTTDAEIARFELVALTDDLQYFPQYQAVFLYRLDLEQRAPGAVAQLARLAGKIDNPQMIALNTRAQNHEPEAAVAADFLRTVLGLAEPTPRASMASYIARLLLQHLWLVAVSLSAAVLVAVPLGIVAAYRPRLGQAVLAISGVVQTIPALALLVFMIPLPLVGGTGPMPAIAALFLYSLLPIVRNTCTGLRDIPLHLREAAAGLGLPWSAQLRLIELPLAMRSILAGIKTAAVINVGTATLGAFIGAGGLGEAIQTGIQLHDTGLLLQGAVPAAVLALVVQAGFEGLERWLVPHGLRLVGANER